MSDGNPGDSKASAAAPGGADSRLRLGMETTLMAWIRTGLALMGFGFVVARFGIFLRQVAEMGHITPRQIHISLWFGIALIAMGVGVNVISAWMYYPFMLRFRKDETDLPATWRLSIVLSYVMAAVGVAMALFLLLVEF